MNNNLIQLHDWQPELMMEMKDQHGRLYRWDFNRVRYRHFPVTKKIKQGTEILADRNALAFAIMNSMKIDHRAVSTRDGLFYQLKEYIQWCDKHYCSTFNGESVQNYCMSIYMQLLKGQIKKSTYKQIRTQVTTLCRFLDHPMTWFDELPVVNCDDTESFEAYSQSDLKQLLPLLRAIFKQLSVQFLDNPDLHLKSKKHSPTMNFRWKGQSFPIRTGLTRLMVAATYLLAYYTFCNTSTLLQLKRPSIASQPLGDVWYSMPAFKRRAFKTLTVEIGDHKLNIPKYCLDFFDTLLKVSQAVDRQPEALLLQTVVNGHHKTITPYHFRDFNVSILRKWFALVDSRGRELRPVISRFRETGSLMTQLRLGDIAAAELLDNTPSTIRRHYSTGNHHDNNAMMQETIAIRVHQAKHKVSLSVAKSQVMETLNIQVLTYEEWLTQTLPTSVSAHGSHCKQPFLEQSEAFSRRAQRHHLSDGERLACAELLKCFGCEHQVIVQSTEDIWCLLSFKEALEESRYFHLDSHHFHKNFGEVIHFIEKRILPNIKRPILLQAQDKLMIEGRHTLWKDITSVILLQGKTA